MIEIHAIPLGMLQTNCYILTREGSRRCVVIDPGQQPQPLLDYLQQNQLTVDAILLTHGHFDHVGGVRTLVAETDAPVYLNEADLALPPRMTDGPLYYTASYGEGSQVEAAGLTFQVISTPGHTPGSVCLLTEDCMFSGDTLFAGSCGRTDFPGGSSQDMLSSLHRLSALDRDYRVFPGHGESTTLAREKQYNPYMN